MRLLFAILSIGLIPELIAQCDGYNDHGFEIRSGLYYRVDSMMSPCSESWFQITNAFEVRQFYNGNYEHCLVGLPTCSPKETYKWIAANPVMFKILADEGCSEYDLFRKSEVISCNEMIMTYMYQGQAYTDTLKFFKKKLIFISSSIDSMTTTEWEFQFIGK